MKEIIKNIYYVGVNDHNVDLFEGQYKVPNGMSYNSYLILDEKVAIFDTVDKHFGNEWLNNIKEVLQDRKPDYLIIQHMEPDHSANIINFLNVYPDVVVVSNDKAFKMMNQFFHQEIKNKLVVKENDTLSLGEHEFKFIFAPMVHWPEVMMTYELNTKSFFSADAFGKFGALDIEQDWLDEARRYYIGIVGKYGLQVQSLFKKVANVEINRILPLHGPVLDSNLNYYLNYYNIWSKYESESDDIAIFYSSVYGNTKAACERLHSKLIHKYKKNVVIYDLARTDLSFAVSEAFKYKNIILATTTYNMGIFPIMETFLTHLVERNFQNKNIGIIENGSWAPVAARIIKEKLANSKNLNYIEPNVTLLSSLDETSITKLDELANNFANNVIKNQVSSGKRKWVCKICGYTYEGEEFPKDFICPICKHPASDFEEIK